MANDNLNNPVTVRAVSLSASSLPRGLSPAYEQYVLSQSTDLTAIAGKANEAGGGAYDAQVKNDEQDVVLADHNSRITANTNAITLIEVRLTTAEGEIITLRSDVNTLISDVNAVEASVSAIQADYVSKSASANQSVQAAGGSLLVGNISSPTTDKLQVSGSQNVSVSYKVSGLQVVGPRRTGWTLSSGSPNRGAFDANTIYPISNPPTVAELQFLSTGLTIARQRIKALEDDGMSHGLIGV